MGKPVNLEDYDQTNFGSGQPGAKARFAATIAIQENPDGSLSWVGRDDRGVETGAFNTLREVISEFAIQRMLKSYAPPDHSVVSQTVERLTNVFQ